MSAGSQLRRGISKEVSERGNNQSYLIVLFSPKNNRRYTCAGLVMFMHVILMEGDLDVLRFDLEPDPVMTVIDGEVVRTRLDAHVWTAESSLPIWTEFKRESDVGPDRKGRARNQLSAQAQAASLAGARYQLKTERDLEKKDVPFTNWLYLCSCMNRARHLSSLNEENALLELLDRRGQITLTEAITVRSLDPAILLAALGKLFAAGTLDANLDHQLLSRATLIRMRKVGR